jgi:hypothetical protein
MLSSSRITLFKKSAGRNDEFERYLMSSETHMSGIINLDSTRAYVMTLPLSFFVSVKSAVKCADQNVAVGQRPRGKADAMPYESFRIINVHHRGSNAHSLVLIKSRAIKTNPHHIAIFESNGRNGFCSIRILDDHCSRKTQSIQIKNVTKAYTSISPEFNINYGSDANNPGYCGIYSIICIVAFRHYRSKTGARWLANWTKLLMHMSHCIDRNAGCLGVELAARVQEIIASNACSCAERKIIAAIRACR